MKQYAIIIVDIIALIVITFLAYNTISRSVKLTETNDYVIIYQIFKEVVRKDRDIRIKGHRQMHQTKKSYQSDSIKLEISTGMIIHRKITETTFQKQEPEDKMYTASQLYLMLKNPIRASVLDSMFRAELLEKGIPAQTAIIYEGLFNEIKQKDFSNSDFSFYQTTYCLPPVLIGIPDLNFKIILNGYIQLPFFYLLRKTPNLGIHMAIYVFLFLVFITIAGRPLKKKDKKEKEAPVETEITSEEIISEKAFTEETVPVETTPEEIISEEIIPEVATPVKYIPEKADFELFITGDFYINKNTGEIRHREKNILQLKQYRLKLFLLLLESPDHYQDLGTIKSQIWNNPKVENDRINKTVIRLRKDLESASVPFSIETVRALGYKITDSPE